MSGANRVQQAQDEREKYVMAFNDTMLKIWQEQITLLGVIDTHSLLRSPTALPVRTDGRFFEVGLSQAFLEYGLWQDYGTGREIPRKPRAVSNSFEHSRGEAGIGQSQIPRGNSGELSCKSSAVSNSFEHSRGEADIGRSQVGLEKVRGRRRWFSRKYYASVMNIKEFFADNLGKEYQGILSDIFDDKGLRGR